MFDTCNCEDSEDCMCAALSSYVHACAAKGVLLSGWRDNVCCECSVGHQGSLAQVRPPHGWNLDPVTLAQGHLGPWTAVAIISCPMSARTFRPIVSTMVSLVYVREEQGPCQFPQPLISLYHFFLL